MPFQTASYKLAIVFLNQLIFSLLWVQFQPTKRSILRKGNFSFDSERPRNAPALPFYAGGKAGGCQQFPQFTQKIYNLCNFNLCKNNFRDVTAFLATLKAAFSIGGFATSDRKCTFVSSLILLLSCLVLFFFDAIFDATSKTSEGRGKDIVFYKKYIKCSCRDGNRLNCKIKSDVLCCICITCEGLSLDLLVI